MTEQITYFFMVYTTLVVISSLSMIYTSALHVSHYAALRASIFHYISHRMRTQGHKIAGTWARLNERSYALNNKLIDTQADRTVYLTHGGSTEDLHRIKSRVFQRFNATALALVEQPTDSARGVQQLQKKLLRTAQRESLATLKDSHLHRVLINYFVNLLDVLGRSAAAGFIVSSLVITFLIARTGEFNVHAGASFAVSFIFSSIFGTAFLARNYPPETRVRNTVLLVAVSAVVASASVGIIFYT